MKGAKHTAKQRFLVVDDYGQGGVWAFVWARSVDEIETTFRDLKVVEVFPSWLTAEELGRHRADNDL